MSKSLQRAGLFAGVAFRASSSAPAAHPQDIEAQDVEAQGADAPPSHREEVSAVEEVVVTARRREERLIDVPVTATTFNEKQLSRYATQNMNDLAAQVPTLVISRSGGAGAGGSLSLRGIVGSASDAGIEQTVAVNIDGVQTSRGRIVSAGILDLASTEVLLGPQSLFFGKNSPGGVVSFTSVSPGYNFEGYVRGGYGFEANRGTLEGAVSVPITDTLAIRLAARYEESDGYYINTARPRLGHLAGETSFTVPPTDKHPAGYKDTIARLTVRWRPVDTLDVNFNILGSWRRDNSATGNSIILSCAPGRPAATTAGRVDPFGDCIPDHQLSVAGVPPEVAATMPYANRDGRPFNDVDQYLSSLNINYEFGPFTLTAVSGLYYYQSRQLDQFDGTSWSQFDGSARDMNRTFSQEFRLASDFDGPINFTTGVYYSHDSRAFSQVVKLANPGPDPATGRFYDAQSKDYNSNDTYSIFAQVMWDITPELELSGGARYTEEHKDGSVRNVWVNPGAVPYGLYYPQGVVVGGKIEADNISPEVTLTYKPRSNLSFYAAYKTGYLSPGFSNPGNLNAKTAFDTITFGEETAKGGEVGAKGSLFDGRLVGDLSIYHYNFVGLQATSFDNATNQYVTKNVGEAKTEGFQIQANGRLTEEITLRGSLAYTNAKYIEFLNLNCYTGQTLAQGCTPQGQDVSGRQFATVPKWTLNYGATWERPLVNGLWFGLSADAYYRSSYNYHSTFRPGYVQKAYTRVNLAARIYPEDGPWEAAFIVKNLTDELYINGGGDKTAGAIGDISGSIGDPREFEVQLTYRF
jgi:outer membrane receptor protein involved in Fe transport